MGVAGLDETKPLVIGEDNLHILNYTCNILDVKLKINY